MAASIRQLLARIADSDGCSGRRGLARRALESWSGRALPVHGITVNLAELSKGQTGAQGMAAGLLALVPQLQFLQYALEVDSELDILNNAVTVYHSAGIRYSKHVGAPPEGRILRAHPSFGMDKTCRFDNVQIEG